MPNRGKINNRERAKQINDFSNLKYGSITPTDIDGLIEYHKNAYVIIEIKYNNAEMPPGQMWALERLTDDLEKSGKPTICILANHNIDDPEKDVDVSNTIVIKYRRNKKWVETEKCTTKQIIDQFLTTVEKNTTSLSFSQAWKKITRK